MNGKTAKKRRKYFEKLSVNCDDRLGAWYFCSVIMPNDTKLGLIRLEDGRLVRLG
jgi:hypothetical protein